jgi:hypothetical protein
MSERARAALSRVGLAVVLIVAADAGYTWFVTNETALVVDEIVARDGEVVTDDATSIGMMHRTELELAADGSTDRIARARYLWVMAVAIGLSAVVESSSAAADIRRAIALAGAITLAVGLAPRVIYSDQIGVLEQLFT